MNEKIFGIYIVIPLIYTIYFLFKKRWENFTLILIISTSFIIGGLELLGIGNDNLLRFGRDIVLLFFIIKTYFIHKEVLIRYNIILLVLYLSVVILSAYLNNTEIVSIIQFLKLYLLLLLFYTSIKKINLSRNMFFDIYRYIKIMFIIQLFSSIFKFLLIGQSEAIIGTISVKSGSLTTALVMVSFCFLLSKFLLGNMRLLPFLFMFIIIVFFGLVGEKRVILFTIPIMFVIGVFVNYRKIRNNNYLKKSLLVIFFLILFSSWLQVILNPTLNRENKMGGKFDLAFVLNYLIDYNNLDSKSYNPRSRIDGYWYATNKIFVEATEQFFFGYGPGYLEKNSLSAKNIFEKEMNMDEYALSKIGISYGARTGFLWVTIQIGIFGAFIYLMFFYLSLKGLNMRLISIPSIEVEIINGVILSFIYIILDFLLYSKIFITINAVTCSLIILIAYYHNTLAEIRKSVK